MADHDEHEGASYSSFALGYNIPNFLGIENYSICATRMRFPLGGLQAVGLIEADPPRTANRNGNFSAANVKLTGQALSLMTSKMGDAAMGLAGSSDTVKELWSRLNSQYLIKWDGGLNQFFLRG